MTNQGSEAEFQLRQSASEAHILAILGLLSLHWQVGFLETQTLGGQIFVLALFPYNYPS